MCELDAADVEALLDAQQPAVDERASVPGARRPQQNG